MSYTARRQAIAIPRMNTGIAIPRRFGLGQAKIVPGQISFQTLPEGRSGFPNLDPLVRAGLPIAPYIEHGSWETGQPDIMRYGLDPYRGIMGLGAVPARRRRRRRAGQALGQILTSSICDPTTVSTAFQARLTSALNAGSQAALVGGAVAGVIGALAGKRSTLLGGVAGAVVGWTANLVWTATHRV
jgi:hypothetical protein